MRRFAQCGLLLGLAGLLAIGMAAPSAFAGNNLLGNGFPSGPHFNLNILGKKADFVCPSQGDYLASTPDQNVIYVPRTGSDISILMESGAKGPKNDPSLAALKVTDWCSQDFDGDAAVMQLPKDPDGYAVYARILGKPGKVDPANFAFTGRNLALVEDEFGNDLLGLGLITESEITDFSGFVLKRFDTDKKGRGAQKAKNITALFLFNGKVCAINNQGAFCADADPACTPGPTVCCVPFGDDGSGNLIEASSCTDPDLVAFAACVPQEEGACPTSITYDSTTTETVCEVKTQCKEFVDQWIFNIADFVNVLFGADNTGSYNVQIRFYPLPLQNNQTP